jgi:uncharacterized tellurite resistance protein B-like protein
MGFWDLFSNKNDGSTKNKHSTLHYELQEKFSTLEEPELIKVTCIAGLLARVAYVDFELDPAEEKNMKFALEEMTSFSPGDIDSIVKIAIKHIKELAGLENHKYVYSLKDILDRNARYEVVVALFCLAASDGVVENIESEEIRLIVKGLDLAFLSCPSKSVRQARST